MKLIWAFLLALSLIGGPVAAQVLPATGCAMSADEMGSGHEKMPCCNPDCTTPAVAAVLPGALLGPDDIPPLVSLVGDITAGSLSSAVVPMDDPPPRTFFA